MYILIKHIALSMATWNNDLLFTPKLPLVLYFHAGKIARQFGYSARGTPCCLLAWYHSIGNYEMLFRFSLLKIIDTHLFSLVSKVLERRVFNSIKDHMFSQINPCQHGFLRGKNCVTQVIEVFDKIRNQLDRGKQIDVIYLDMSKAFDNVSHNRLLLRLREFGF